MGCKWGLPKSTSRKCILQLREVNELLQELQRKYEKQKICLEDEIRTGIKKKENKSILMGKLRRKKIVMHYIGVCQKKIDNLMHKEYALEQINITKMQLDAIKSTVSVFKNFNKTNDVEKLEKLYDQLQDFTDDMKDINDLIENQPLMEFDDDELLKELDELGEFKSIVATVQLPDVPTDVPVDTRPSPGTPLLE